jgi:hypothetical protein
VARLDEAVDQILSAVVEIVRGSADLAGIAQVVRGERARPMPELPCIWVLPEPATASQGVYGAEEAWMMPIALAALVRSDDPEEGARRAARYAALARRAVLGVGRLDLPFVVDVRSSKVDLAARRDPNRNLYWADATVEVTFDVEEEEP